MTRASDRSGNRQDAQRLGPKGESAVGLPMRTYRDFLVHKPGLPIRRPFTIDREQAA